MPKMSIVDPIILDNSFPTDLMFRLYGHGHL